jgi:hypothetical protein
MNRYRAWIDVSDLRRLFAVQLISWLTWGTLMGLAWTLLPDGPGSPRLPSGIPLVLSRNRADDASAFDPVQDAMKHDAYQAIASLPGPPRLSAFAREGWVHVAPLPQRQWPGSPHEISGVSLCCLSIWPWLVSGLL